MRDCTDITIILDNSGSMQSVKQGTIEGFNAFLAEQKSIPGNAWWTLVKFNNRREVVYSQVDQTKVNQLNNENYTCGGGTALLDAVCQTIDETGERLAKLPEYLRPNKVLFIILTDGEENSSLVFNLKQMQDRIKHQQDVYKWNFIFLGANQDAIQVAAKYNIPVGNALTYAYSNAGTSEAFNKMSGATRSVKLGNTQDLLVSP